MESVSDSFFNCLIMIMERLIIVTNVKNDLLNFILVFYVCFGCISICSILQKDQREVQLNIIIHPMHTPPNKLIIMVILSSPIVKILSPYFLQTF